VKGIVGIGIDLDIVKNLLTEVWTNLLICMILWIFLLLTRRYDISEKVKSNCRSGVDNIITQINEQSQIRKEIIDGNM